VSGPNQRDADGDGGGITGTGSVTTALLTGSATANVALTGSNTVSTLGNFTVSGGSLTLVDNSNLSLTNTISGTNLFIEVAPLDTIAVGTGATAASLSAPRVSLLLSPTD